MTQDPSTEGRGAAHANDGRTTRFLGSLKDALAAASREESADEKQQNSHAEVRNEAPPAIPQRSTNTAQVKSADQKGTAETPNRELPSAGSAAKAARGSSKPLEEHAVKLHKLPTTRVIKGEELKDTGQTKDKAADRARTAEADTARTQLVRGKQTFERGAFEKDPVVGWLVVVGGPGIGNYRPIFEGNNALGRSAQNRIPIDFGDEAISSDEQAYIRYDSSDRSFLFVPNLAKTNVVSVNNLKPTGAVALSHMDVIVMGRTQLVFVPFCGAEFDWSALGETTKS